MDDTKLTEFLAFQLRQIAQEKKYREQVYDTYELPYGILLGREAAYKAVQTLLKTW